MTPEERAYEIARLEKEIKEEKFEYIFTRGCFGGLIFFFIGIPLLAGVAFVVGIFGGWLLNDPGDGAIIGVIFFFILLLGGIGSYIDEGMKHRKRKEQLNDLRKEQLDALTQQKRED